MPRYVIETDEPIGQCWQCPCYAYGKFADECQLAERYHPNADGLDNGIRQRPEWCPLKPLD